VAWKAIVLYQCLVRRALDAADGSLLGWNANNLLAAITMARSFVGNSAHGIVNGLAGSLGFGAGISAANLGTESVVVPLNY
jgi:hypothetical protein